MMSDRAVFHDSWEPEVFRAEVFAMSEGIRGGYVLIYARCNPDEDDLRRRSDVFLNFTPQQARAFAHAVIEAADRAEGLGLPRLPTTTEEAADLVRSLISPTKEADHART